MISRSTIVALVAVLLSLAVHFIGLRFTWSLQPEPPSFDNEVSTQITAPGSAFKDLAEPINEPVRPEPSPAPEPPVEAAPVPEPADAPTSQALVASANPQQVTAPDTGIVQSVQPETIEPSAPESNKGPAPAAVEPAGAEESAVEDARLVPPAGADAVTAAPQGQPIERAEPSSAEPQTSAVSPPVAVPSAAVPVPPVAATAVPVVPLEPSENEQESPDVTLEVEEEPSQDPAETLETDPSELAVTTSLRPQLRAERPSAEPRGLPDGSSADNETRLAPSQVIESPLTAYKRDGTDVFGGIRGGARSSGQGFGSARGPGNSDVTNYAGQVLMHLNRTPPVAVSARGWARIFFQINPDGTLASVDIIDGSGSREIDLAAKQQVRNAAPFPRPPGGKSRRLNFVYQIE